MYNGDDIEIFYGIYGNSLISFMTNDEDEWMITVYRCGCDVFKIVGSDGMTIRPVLRDNDKLQMLIEYIEKFGEVEGTKLFEEMLNRLGE